MSDKKRPDNKTNLWGNLDIWAPEVRGLGVGQEDFCTSADLLVDLTGGGRLTRLKTNSEVAGELELSKLANPETAEAALAWKENLAADRVDFNPAHKSHLTHSLPEDSVRFFSLALTTAIPSKDGPEPVKVMVRDATDQDGSVRNSNLFFSTVYQAGNFLMNDSRYGWSDRAQEPYTFYHEMLRGHPVGQRLPQLHPSAPTGGDYLGCHLVTKEECSAIFGATTPDQLALELTRLMVLFSDGHNNELMARDLVRGMCGSEHLPSSFAGSAAHYASAIRSAMGRLTTAYTAYERSPAGRHGRLFQEYLETKIIPEKNFRSDVEAFRYLASNPAELDDWLYRPEALTWVLARRVAEDGPNAALSSNLESAIRDTQSKVLRFTTLLDSRWQSSYTGSTKELIATLIARFGHPVGIPTKDLTVTDFLPGGYLAGSGWLKVKSGANFGFTVDFPVDENGKPSDNMTDWENLNPSCTVRSSGSNDSKGSKSHAWKELGDLAEACASAAEAWQVAYNRALPRDSLYSAALLSLIDPSLNGQSQDDYSGTVRGGYHQWLRGVELALGAKMLYFPTTRSRISALARRLATEVTGDNAVCPRGTLSLAEIDLSNWRLVRLSDNQMGNEYGLNRLKEDVEAPFNFDKLGREVHEEVQQQIRYHGPAEGLITYRQPPEDFVRPLVGRQRGEAVRVFMETPGTYLRRTGCAGFTLGVGRAVYEQILAPLAPWLAYRDTAFGLTTDCTTTVNNAPGRLSLDPYMLLAQGSGTITVDGFPELPVQNFNKMMTVGPARRGDNMPRRLRFASLALGEKAGPNGLVDANLASLDQLFEIDNIHEHLMDHALVTLDEPEYATETEGAFWQEPELFCKDFELGEMGTAYRLGATEEEKKALLQMLLAGRQSVYQELTSPGRGLLSLYQVTMSIPADSRLVFGNLGNTGVSFEKGGHVPEYRAEGLVRGLCVTRRDSGSFMVGPKLSKVASTQSRASDKFIPLEAGLFGSRSGHTITGLENVPPKWSGEAPRLDATYRRQWAELVWIYGESLNLEPNEMPGVDDEKRSLWAEFIKLCRSRLEDSRRTHEAFLIPEMMFLHPTGRIGTPTLWLVNAVEASEDEAMLLAATGRTTEIRKDLARLAKESAVKLPMREGGYDEWFKERVAHYGAVLKTKT